MPRTIWKFVIPIQDEPTIIRCAAAFRVVLAAADPASGKPAIWVEHDPDAPQCEHRIILYGTGHLIAGTGGYPSDVHLGSLTSDRYVWHIYERKGG